MARIIISVLLIALGGWMVYSQLSKGRRCTESATATIVGREKKRVRSSKGRRTTHYAPVLEYTVNGQTVRATADVDSIFAGKYKDGDTLEIRYNPQQPENMVVRGKSLRSALLGGGLLIIVGLVSLYFSLR